MNSIIEKLGINTPDKIESVGDVFKIYELAGMHKPRITDDHLFEDAKILKTRLDDKNEMVEALIDAVDICEDFFDDGEPCMPLYRQKKSIEKATGKSWEEIKELL